MRHGISIVRHLHGTFRFGRLKYLFGFPFVALVEFGRHKLLGPIGVRVVMFSDDLINRLIRYPRAIASRIRIMRLRMCGVRLGRKCWIRRIHVPRNPWDIVTRRHGCTG